MGNIPSVAPGQLATADQYNALQAGLNGVTENSYTSWKLVQTIPASNVVSNVGSLAGIYIDDVNGILYIANTNNNWFQAFSISSGASLYSNDSASSGFLAPFSVFGASATSNNANRFTSATGLYIAGVVLTSLSTVSPAVVSKGSLLWTATESYTLATNFVAYSQVGPVISVTGRYIVFIPFTSSGTFSNIYVYEGQP